MSISDDILAIAKQGNAVFLAGVRAGEENSARKLSIAIDALRRIALPAGGASGLESGMEKAMRLCAATALDRIGEALTP